MGVRAEGKGVLWLGVNGGGKSLIATYPEHFVFISLLKLCREGGGREGVYLDDIEGT